MSIAGRLRPLLLGLALVGAACSAAPAQPTPAPATSPPAPGALIAAVGTDRAAYPPGTPVQIEVALHNRSGAPFSGQVRLAFEHLGHIAAPAQAQPVERLAAGATRTLTFRWSPPPADFTGYRVAATALAGDTPIDQAASAVDVSSDWRKFPRYGFVSRFGAEVDPAAVIDALNRYHINGLQFYDWQWQHHRPYSPAPAWPDIAGRSTDRATLEQLIAQAHRRGMLALNYNLAFGAYDGYWRDGSGVKLEWGLFTQAGGGYTPAEQDFHPLPATWASPKLFVFDPANRDWQQYIFAQERQVFAHFGFDGWHIDTLGKRGLRWNWDQQIVDMPDAYVDFVSQARAALGTRVVFNSVGGYAQNQIADGAPVDLIYSELWENDGISTYADIVDLVERARAHTGKALVLPGYMNKAYAEQTPTGTTRTFREPSVRLADAVIFAAGAAHLELGDGDGMLSNEYFPNQRLVMSDTLRAAMRDYYDFLVAYENLLRDDATADTSRLTIDGQPTSGDGRPGTIWLLPRRAGGRAVLHLINLTHNRLRLWRDTGAIYPAPTPLTGLALKLYTEPADAGATLWYATPDANHGQASMLDYTRGTDAQGSFMRFTLPRLEYWDLLWLERGQT